MRGKRKSAGGRQGDHAQATSRRKLQRLKNDMDVNGDAIPTKNEDEKTSGANERAEIPSEKQSNLRENESNPMLNDVVLGNLFQFCPAETLANCRLVSKQWLKESLTAWRSTSILRLAPYQKRRDKIRVGRKLTTVDKLLSYLDRECTAKPYRRLQLCDWKFRQTDDDSSEQDGHAKLWNILRQNLTDLKLKGYFFADVEQFRRVIFQSCPNLKTLTMESTTLRTFPKNLQHRIAPTPSKYTPPIFGEQVKLKSLSLSDSSERSFRRFLPVSWLELLSHFPSLTSLTMKAPVDQSQVLFEILNSIKMIRAEDGRKLPLKTFSIGMLQLVESRSSRDLMGLLMELHLPLQSLKISCDQSVDGQNWLSQNDIHGLLEQNCSSLTNLRFSLNPYFFHPYRGWQDPHLCLSIPIRLQLENLRELTLESAVLCSSLKFIRSTPQLQKLVIRGRHLIGSGYKGEVRHGRRVPLISNVPQDELVDFTLHNLTTLTLEYVVSDDDILRLTKWMPHMTHLQIFLNDSQFLIVCNSWRKLEELYVLGKALTDEGVTGRRFRGATNSFSKTKETSRKVLRPNVTLLESLKYFHAVKARLTDASILYGLARLPNLEGVSLTNSEIGTAGMKALHDKCVSVKTE